MYSFIPRRLPSRWLRLMTTLITLVVMFWIVQTAKNAFDARSKKANVQTKLENLFKDLKNKEEIPNEDDTDNQFTSDEADEEEVEEEEINWKVFVFYLLQSDDFEEEIECGPFHCKFLTDTANLSQADAVIVDGLLLSQTKDRIKPVRTSPDQVWIYFSKEPWSSYSADFPHGEWNGIFNWTYTYHRDSDFIVKGQEVVQGKGNYEALWGLSMKTKSKHVLWITNQCQTDSKSEVYVNDLKKYINVDIMGDCGDPKCNDDDNTPSCYEDYFFYLSFETTFCKDYVTNQFFKTFEHPIVPIVRGGANYTKMFSKDLAINTADFYNPKHLAQYLHTLMYNRTAYTAYLRRKINFVIMERGNSHCIMCSHLHQLHLHRKSYRNIAAWMDTCRKPTDIYN